MYSADGQIYAPIAARSSAKAVHAQGQSVQQVAQVWMMEHLTESPPAMGWSGWLTLNDSTVIDSGSSFMAYLQEVSQCGAGCTHRNRGAIRLQAKKGGTYLME
jgi:hypothetical protein